MKIKKYLSGLLTAVIIFGGAIVPNDQSFTKNIVIEVSAASSSKLKAPSGIKTTTTINSVTLQWQKVTGADAYRVFMYNADSDEYEKYKDVTGTKCTIKNLKSGAKYKFKVAALVSKNGKKSLQTKSGKIEIATKKASVSLLAAPKNISSESDEFSITLKWDSVKGADAYRLYMYNPSNKKYEIRSAEILSTTYTIDELESNTAYKFKVAALVDEDNSYTTQTLSSEISVKTDSMSVRSEPGEWIKPFYGAKMSTVLKSCGISNYSEYQNSASKYSYMGTVLIEGEPHLLSVHFNSKKRFCLYYIYKTASKQEFESALNKYIDEYGRNYEYAYNAYLWEVSSVKMVVLMYNDEYGILGYGECNPFYMEVNN